MQRPMLAIARMWRGRAGWLLLGLAASLASLGTGVSLMTQSAATLSAALGGVAVAAAVLPWLGATRVAFRYAERLTTHDATFRALADIRVWFFQALAAGSAGGLGFRRAGDVLARLVSDVEALDGLYLRILVPLACAAVLVPAVMLLVSTQSVALAAALGAWLAVAAFVLPAFAARWAGEAGVSLAAAAGALRVTALDALTGLREVRAFGAEGRMLAAVQARERVLYAAEQAVSRRVSLAGAGAFLCGQAALLCVLAWAPSAPGAAVAVLFLTVASFEAVSGLARAGGLAGHVQAAAARVLDAAHPVGTAVVPTAALGTGSGLRFEAVTFGWRADQAVFDGLTLDVPQGAKVAILGPSGAGKSTLAALALRVVPPHAGRVLLGGADIAAASPEEVRRRVAWLSQQTHLFDDTVRANLLLARPDADDAALWAALEAARIADRVRASPDGLDTWVGEHGTRFSGGEGRRLALARALLSDAPILILDEPAAGLDAETERAFFATLNESAEARTVVLIVHRLTGVERLDRIWRLSGGRAVAAAG